MKVSKRRGFNIDSILKRISEVRTLNSDGSYSMSSFGVLDDLESYLITAIEIEGKTDAFVRRITKKAIHTEQYLTESQFINHCKRIAYENITNNQKAYKVLFPIWGGTDLPYGRRRWNDVSISFNIDKNSKFARNAIQDREIQIEESKKSNSKTVYDFQNLPLALCSVKGIDIYDAFEQAEKAISKELGLYSLISSRGQFIFTDDAEKPINNILLAPHMTVHNPNGKIASNIYWYSRWPISLRMKITSSEEVEKIRNRLKSLPWRGDAEMALLRHYLAFSQCDLESSFLDGWRLLEIIGGDKTEQSDTLVKRTAWFFENRDQYYQIGRHLMERRNLISHGRPVRDDNNEGLAFQMKKFITPFLHAFLTNPFNFHDIKELWSFCDLPIDKKVRERRAYILRCSSKFRQEE